MPREPLKLKIAKPCPVSWEGMAGDDIARFCGICQKTVYDLSSMTDDAARELIEAREGNVCVRFYQRQDGTVMTQDCGFGAQRAGDRFRTAARTAGGVMAALAGLMATPIRGAIAPEPVAVMGGLQAVHERVGEPIPMVEVKGKIAAPLNVKEQPAAPTVTPEPERVRVMMGAPRPPRKKHAL